MDTRSSSALDGGDLWAIDTVVNLNLDDPRVEYFGNRQAFDAQTGADQRPRRITPEYLLERMDRAHIEHAFLIASKCGTRAHEVHGRVPYEVVAEVVRAYPDRFSGLAGMDPTEGMQGLRELEIAINDYGFVGAHLYPHWFEMAPDHARYYPIYAKCCELNIPIQMQVGHCLLYTRDRPLKSVGRPITLDTIACDFPDLKLVGIHTGWPWTEEMISVAYKHPNVYIGSDAYAPKHWSKELVHYINSFGSHKVLFGTDYPVIDIERARSEVEELGLREKSRVQFLRNNAIDLYSLNLVRAAPDASAQEGA